MDNPFEKKANIHKEQWDGKTEKSVDFASVPKANHAMSTHLATNGSIALEKGFNEIDGATAIVLEKVGKTKLWGETSYEVKQADGSMPL